LTELTFQVAIRTDDHGIQSRLVRRPWFKAEPVDETFFDSAPARIEETFEIARPAAEVWSELTQGNPLSWCRIIDRIDWTSPAPFRVGTTRTVHALKGTNVMNEHFFRWEEGRRKSFYVLDATAPLFQRFAEDYVVEPTSDSSCRFTWTIAFASRPAMRAGTPVNKRLLGTLFTDTRKHFSA
jgi:hypothetical protein